MNKRLITLLLSLLTPGLGYIQNDDKKSFYKTIAFIFGIIIFAVMQRLFTGFWSLTFVIVALISIYVFAAIHATLTVKATSSKIKNPVLLKLFFTMSFLLITGLSFANRRTLMGFDIMSMSVPVMQPAILQGDKFLVDTWSYKRALPKRGDVIVHSFSGQQGLYLNRIIAIENDKIEINDGKVFLNGRILNEPFVLTTNVTRPQSKNMRSLIISKGNYFMMGDNRDASFGDSRFSGTITIDNIVGKTTDVISSQDKSRIGRAIK